MNTLSKSTTSPSPSASAGWRITRYLLVGAAVLATLVAVFHTVENWRGQRAWEKCRRALEARGEELDWAAYIPAPVADDQNFYRAPQMQEWFVKKSFGTLGVQSPNGPKPFEPTPRPDTDLVVAEVRVVAASTPLDSPRPDAVLRYEDPTAREQAAKLLDAALGPCVIGSKPCVLVARPLEEFKPLQMVLQAEAAPTVKELAAFFPSNPVTNWALASGDAGHLRVDSAGSNVFRVSLKEPVYGAADYLDWTDPLTADFDLVRQALERPYARIDCDYQQPYGIDIPNFVNIREAARILSQRAQSYLLLGQPEKAWHELSLVHDLCEILQAKPAGKPLTLVGAMINVAVAGLYTGIVEDGLRLHAWREPQLLALERQLNLADLLSPVMKAFQEERAATCRTFEITKRSELVKLFNLGSSGSTWRDKFGDAVSTLAFACMPRGWFYQNMAVGGEAGKDFLGSVEPTNQIVRPHQADQYYHGLEGRLQRHSPYTFLVAISTPNFLRAVQTLARNQTLVNQARVACALERYRLAQGQYPGTLDALIPRFVENLPHDLIGGQPLNYHRTDGGGYRLYSIGWDETDNGGVPGQSREEGDWVWELR